MTVCAQPCVLWGAMGEEAVLHLECVPAQQDGEEINVKQVIIAYLGIGTDLK